MSKSKPWKDGPHATGRPKRTLQCEAHGTVPWNGEIVCEKCDRIYTTHDPALASHAPEVCTCGDRLMPRESKDGGQVFTGRAICSQCYARWAPLGRVPSVPAIVQ